MIVIEPGNTNIDEFPTDYEDYPSFYNVIEGGDIGQGHSINPITGQAYEPQIVPRGDYARVLAEFWADGPDSETPPGHWFTILNVVNELFRYLRSRSALFPVGELDGTRSQIRIFIINL